MRQTLGLSLLLVAALAAPVSGTAAERDGMACRREGSGSGCGRGGGGMGRCGGACARSAGPDAGPAASGRSDQELFHWLIARRDAIRRSVEVTPDGVVTLTESDDPDTAEGIREHVAAMHARLLEGRPIHRRDPLFAAIFEQREQIEMRLEETTQGLRVVERSDDPWVARLIQAHAEVVSGFLENGRAEMHRNHPVPPKP